MLCISRVTIAVIVLIVFAALANEQITILEKATKQKLIPNMDGIIKNLQAISEGTAYAYQTTTLMPLLTDMKNYNDYISGNLTITVSIFVDSTSFVF